MITFTGIKFQFETCLFIHDTVIIVARGALLGDTSLVSSDKSLASHWSTNTHLVKRRPQPDGKVDCLQVDIVHGGGHLGEGPEAVPLLVCELDTLDVMFLIIRNQDPEHSVQPQHPVHHKLALQRSGLLMDPVLDLHVVRYSQDIL